MRERERVGGGVYEQLGLRHRGGDGSGEEKEDVCGIGTCRCLYSADTKDEFKSPSLYLGPVEMGSQTPSVL